MKIARLYLKAYGAFSDRWLDFSDGANFHVIYGPNEAGKSTTLRALTGLLFGIDDRTADNFLHQYGQLRIGATLVSEHGGQLSVMRRKARKQTLFAMDAETGAELTDRPLPEETLSPLLGGLDEGLYRALFGLDLEGLTQGSEALLAGKGALGQTLFEAAAGLASLQQLLARLDQDASALFRPRASTSAIHVALKELEEKRKLAREATVRTQAWEQADRSKRQAEAKYAALRADLTALREEQRLLSRITANLPLAAERAAKLAELATLEHIPLLPPEATQQRIETEERLRSAIEAQQQAAAELDRLTHKRASVVVREALLLNAATIERLHHAASEWRGAMERLPRVEVEIATVQETIRALLADIAPGFTPDQARDLIPKRTLIARVQSLTEDYATLHAQDEQYSEHARKLMDARNRLDAELVATPEPVPLDALEAAREDAAGRGNLTGQLFKLDREIVAMQDSLAREAATLWDGPHEELASLRPPLITTLHEYEAEFRRLDEALRTLQAKDIDLERDLGDRERELRGLAAAGEIATHEQVQSARARRAVGWRLIQQGYIERSAAPDQLAAHFDPTQSLPSAYESAVREADRLADLLHADAGRSASYEMMRQRIMDIHKAHAALTEKRNGLITERDNLNARWTSLIASLRQPEISPAAAIEWLQKHRAWVERYMQLASLKREKEELAALLAATRAALQRALSACGLPALTEDESLSAALARTRATVESARQQAVARASLIERIAQNDIDVADIASQQAQLAEKMTLWRQQWNEALVALHLSAGSMPAEVRARIEELSRLSEALQRLETLTREAEAEQATRSMYENDCLALGAAIKASVDCSHADQSVAMLYTELTATREADQLRRRLDADIERETNRAQQAALAEETQRGQLAELVRRAGVQSADELPSVEADSARKRLLSDRINEIEEQLVRSAARPLPEVLFEVEGRDIAFTTARLTEIEASLRERETENETAYEQLLKAKRDLDAIDGSDIAARVHQEAEELTARIARHARNYARVKLGETVLSRVVQSYRERHQGPVLRRAGEIFAKITLGSFAGLITDYEDDTQVLLGQRPDGTRVGVAGMSQGTCDQLFLALRIAAIEEHLKQREAVPLVIDDLLVQFDDARASATLAVLADLALQTQVLFFTHHGHLCELATTALPLGTWRRHDLAA